MCASNYSLQRDHISLYLIIFLINSFPGIDYFVRTIFECSLLFNNKTIPFNFHSFDCFEDETSGFKIYLLRVQTMWQLLLTVYRKVKIYSVLLLITSFDNAIKIFLTKKVLTASPERQTALIKYVRVFFMWQFMICVRVSILTIWLGPRRQIYLLCSKERASNYLLFTEK